VTFPIDGRLGVAEMQHPREVRENAAKLPDEVDFGA
jgi:hypothetical protein